jgi:phosphoglucosamine mutase
MSSRLFGTDGIRGTANIYPMTCDLVQKFGMAAGHYFKRGGHRNRVIIAKDTRLSGYMLEPALVSGFIAAGMDVIMVGPMPTPSVSFLIKSLRADLGVMISASHNPYQDNGLKLFGPDGQKLNDSVEDELENIILTGDFNKMSVSPELLGRAKRLDDAPGRYIEHVKRSFPKGTELSGLRIVIDCANGAAYNLAPTIFWELGAEVIKLGVNPDGVNINQLCGSTHPEAMISRVIETRADIGIALDGDADRVLICDEKGQVVQGDHLIAMIAAKMLKENHLNEKSIVVTQMSNGALDEYMGLLGVKVHRSLVGDRYVAEKMREEGVSFGGEQSGHIILSHYSHTGDGIVAALQVLSLLVESKKKLSSICRPFELQPQVNKSIKFSEKNPLEVTEISNSIESLIDQYSKDCRVLIRKSGTEKLIRILVEGKDKSKIEELAKKISGIITLG